MTAELAIEMARAEGFDLAGIAPLAPPAAAGHFEEWLAAGHHGSMDYLERNRERIVDPRRILPDGKSMLVLGMGHSRPPLALADGARVARYAAGRDYHNLIGKKLKKLGRRLQEAGLVERSRGIVDAGPVLERSHAASAGLGFESKAANLLNREFGPWFFIAEILLDREMEPSSELETGSCGTCTACIDACPTVAILEPGVVDSRLCISYQTIENRAAIPHELRASIGDWAFGCDICSEVCPWGRKAPDLQERFGQHEALRDASPIDWLIEREGFPERFQGSPLRRPGRVGLARNSAIVLGNRPSDPGRAALMTALEADPSAQVREAAAWGLTQGHRDESGVLAALDRAVAREVDDGARAGMRSSLDDGA
ncbi:MAG: epoxyqueuosine reductase [Chlamydiales bacterium]|jgi:epoxyqueuosine reductase